MPLATNARAFVDGFNRGRRRETRDTPNRHNHRWDRAEEDSLLGRFAAGERLRVLARAHQRTFGAINSRLASLMGIQWPDTPEQYRRSGRPIRRRNERNQMPLNSQVIDRLRRGRVEQPSLEEREAQRRQARANEAPAISPNEPSRANEAPAISPNEPFADVSRFMYSPHLRVDPPPAFMAANPVGGWRIYGGSFASSVAQNAAAIAAEQTARAEAAAIAAEQVDRAEADALGSTPRRRQTYTRRGEPSRVEEASPEPEIPSHLEAAVPLTRKHLEAMAQEIRALRPTQEGRAAATQHSTLNKLAYKLATLFEGDNSSFDRARWLEACGVQIAQRN